MNKNTFSYAAVAAMAVLLLLVAASCNRDRFDLDKIGSTEWNPAVAFPLMKADLDVYDVMARIDSSDLITALEPL